MDEVEFVGQFTRQGPPTLNDMFARGLMPDRAELEQARQERQAEEDRRAAREDLELANRAAGDPLGAVTRCQMEVAAARDKVRDLEAQLQEARAVLHRNAEQYLDFSRSAEQVTASVARRSNVPDLLAPAKKALAEANVERMLSAPRPEPRPKRHGGVVSRAEYAHRSEYCVFCTAEGVSDHESYLLHSDPEYNVPVTSPEQFDQADRRAVVNHREISR